MEDEVKVKKLFLIFWLSSMFFLLYGLDQPPPGPNLNPKKALKVYTGWNLLASPLNREIATSTIQNIVKNDIYFFDAKEQSWKNGVGISIPPGTGFWVQVAKDSAISYQQNPNNQFSIKNFQVSLGWNLLGMSAQSERISTISSVIRSKYLTQKLYVSKVNIYDAKNSEWKNPSLLLSR